MQTDEKIEISYVPINELKPAEYNPRRADDKQHKDLTESIRRFGIKDPMIVNSALSRKNIIIGGHFRHRVALELGFTEVPVVYVNIPEIEREKELNLRLNRNLGAWDFDLLADFDESFLDDVGFDSKEIDRIFYLGVTAGEDDVPATRKTSVKSGDMYQLGDHRLLCGDATKKEDVERLMGGEKAVLCLTDPPY